MHHSVVLANLPPDSNSFAFDLNDAGVVVGTIESASDMRFMHAFKWTAGTVEMLPTLGGDYSVARSISHSGLAVGAAQTVARCFHAVVWKKGKASELQTLSNGDTSYANAINNEGEIVGQSNDGQNRQAKAVRWTVDGAVHVLPTQHGSVFSNALALNNRGQIVGFDNAEAALWTQSREIELGSFGDEPNVALDVNDPGDVVGSSAEAEGRMRAFLWRKGHLYNLNRMVPASSGWVLLSAFRINNRGEILAHGFHQGQSRLCLLIPLGNR
jgi:probable HAF family extracellular repeat protein